MSPSLLQCLLSYNVEVGDCLLHAINEENNEAVEMLFFHLEQKKLEGNYDPEKTIVSNSFSPDITPIILAGHKVGDSYGIISLASTRKKQQQQQQQQQQQDQQ